MSASAFPPENQGPRHVAWADVSPEQLNPRLTRRFISGAQSTIAYLQLAEGCIVPTHCHPNEQIASVISGALRFVFNPGARVDAEPATEQIIVRAGEFVVIPAHVPHSAEALEDTVNIDFFAPARADWLSGDDAYLRGSVEESAK